MAAKRSQRREAALWPQVRTLSLGPTARETPQGAPLPFCRGRVRIMSAHAGGMCMRQCAHCRIRLFLFRISSGKEMQANPVTRTNVGDHSARQENGNRFGGCRFPVCASCLLLSKSNPLRWASIWLRMQIEPCHSEHKGTLILIRSESFFFFPYRALSAIIIPINRSMWGIHYDQADPAE